MTIVWNEPLCLDEGCVVNSVARADEADIVRLMKHLFPDRKYTDESALTDFIVTHWAWREPPGDESMSKVEELSVALPDGSGFFVAEVGEPMTDPVCWNRYNKVVQDHRDGTIDMNRTNKERAKRGLPVPWTPNMADIDVNTPPME